MKKDGFDIAFSFTVSRRLRERIDRHLKNLKILRKPQCKRKAWLLEALDEKLKRQRKKSSSEIPKIKALSICLSKELVEKIEARLKLHPKVYTKKKWIIEAIEEKFQNERKFILLKQTSEKQQNDNNSESKTMDSIVSIKN
jgi:hypothetical protein